jgi:hypothetical protein
MTMTPQQASKRGNRKENSSYAYPAQATQPTTQVIKRPLTNADLELFSRFYDNLKRGTRGLAIMSFVFFFIFIIFYFALYDITFDWTIYLVFYLASFIIGLVAIIISIKFVQSRKKISDVLNEGTVIEVKGPAYRSRTARNVTAWTVGPISVMSGPGAVLNMIQEGAQTTVLCIPRMRIALSINNVELMNGARIICPPSFEALAVLEQSLPQEADSKEEIKELETAIDDSIDSNERLTKLKELKDKGLISEEDYENKKKEILVEI